MVGTDADGNGFLELRLGALVKAQPNNEDLKEEGRRFLDQMPIANGSWPHVWRICWQGSPEDPELEEKGVQWLGFAMEHKSWIRAFEPLWDTGRNRDRLIALARRRMQERPDGKGADRLQEILAGEPDASGP